jgi:hypothetical protein
VAEQLKTDASTLKALVDKGDLIAFAADGDELRLPLWSSPGFVDI